MFLFLPQEFTAVCGPVNPVLPEDLAFARTGVSSLFTAIIRMLQTLLSGLWRRLYRSSLSAGILTASPWFSVKATPGSCGVWRAGGYRYSSNWSPRGPHAIACINRRRKHIDGSLSRLMDGRTLSNIISHSRLCGKLGRAGGGNGQNKSIFKLDLQHLTDSRAEASRRPVYSPLCIALYASAFAN